MTVMRTCIGCRSKDSTDQLIRLVCHDNRVVVDQARKASGRGAYVHRDRDCVSNAIARRAIARALRVTGSVETTALDALAN